MEGNLNYKKYFLVFLLLFSSASLLASPLTLMTLSGVGSSTDVALRYLAPLLGKELGRPVVVVNVPGASGVIGLNKFANLPANCSTALVAGATLGYLKATHASSQLDPISGLTPVHGLIQVPLAVLVSTKSDIFTAKDLVDAGITKQGLFGGGATESHYLTIKLLDKSLATKTEIVKYKSIGQVVIDLVAGRLDYIVAAPDNPLISGLINSGSLRIIAAPNHSLVGKKNIATLREQGYAEIEDLGWSALFVHTNTDKQCTSDLSEGLRKVLTTETIKGSAISGILQNLYIESGIKIRDVQIRQLAVIEDILSRE
jgi:tripartite-type tricarboxylate transporter receptor subunit TctC